MLSKNVNNKKCAPEFIFFNEKKIEKIQIIFDVENWLQKSNFDTFWQLPINPKLKIQNSIISFEYIDSLEKIFLTLYPPFENSTTRITIIFRPLNSQIQTYQILTNDEEVYIPSVTSILIAVFNSFQRFHIKVLVARQNLLMVTKKSKNLS